MALNYVLEGDLARLRIAPPGPSRLGDQLWRHTCCEAFIGAAGRTDYHEFNLSPSGEWAAHAFARYREGGPLDDETLNPQIAIERTARTLELSALIDLRRLGVSGTIRLGLSVVAEHEDGAISYWALKHAPGKPDFHHRDAFALELDEIRH
ncbi:MAG TPA: DOMON-like domain-containing protein [Burkholderiales bacterium]